MSASIRSENISKDLFVIQFFCAPYGFFHLQLVLFSRLQLFYCQFLLLFFHIIIYRNFSWFLLVYKTSFIIGVWYFNSLILHHNGSKIYILFELHRDVLHKPSLFWTSLSNNNIGYTLLTTIVFITTIYILSSVINIVMTNVNIVTNFCKLK